MIFGFITGSKTSDPRVHIQEKKTTLSPDRKMLRSIHCNFAQNPIQMSSEKFDSGNAPKPVGLYPHARKVGNLLFLSGVGPRTKGSDGAAGNVPGLKLSAMGNFDEFDFEAQCHSVFQNVRAILEDSGAKWEDLVDVTVFLVDMKRDFKTFNRIYAEYFKDNQPCRTTVEINALPTPIAIELKCIAALSE